MRTIINNILLLFILLISASCKTNNSETLSVLQFNIWSEGTVVEDGFQGIIDNIINANPDIVTFSEVRNYNDSDFILRLTDALQKEGHNYYGNSSTSTGIISKHPIVNQEVIYPLRDDAGSITKAHIDVKGRIVALYAAHLDYRHYA